MSNYLGFEPSDAPSYFFVSYNNEDADRVGQITQRLCHCGVPLWYDHGIDYGEGWETKISAKLQNAQAVILFFTKGILFKDHSYVRKEYKMATEYFDKKVYVVLVDEISNKEVPFDKVPWWIDIQEKQSIRAAGVSDQDTIVTEILKAIGMSTHEGRMNTIIETYRALYDCGKRAEAETYLTEYLRGESLAGKARCMANIYSGKTEGLIGSSCAKEITERLPRPLTDHRGVALDLFVDCLQLTAGDTVFTFGNSVIFHRGALGDAHVINIWRGEENIYTVGQLVEACRLRVYYDVPDDIMYLAYVSEHEERQDGELYVENRISVTTVENPLGHAVCSTFHNLGVFEF